ncbi:MAG: transcriptional regulator [Oligoflexia bacterium]|nr:MAG: transcriptional regulator [Oligoflexia bacterium]
MHVKLTVHMGNLTLQLKIRTRLALFRSDRGLTQQELADAIGVTRATIIAIEKENYNPSLELAFRIARHFKTDIHSIFYVRED